MSDGPFPPTVSAMAFALLKLGVFGFAFGAGAVIAASWLKPSAFDKGEDELPRPLKAIRFGRGA